MAYPSTEGQQEEKLNLIMVENLPMRFLLGKKTIIEEKLRKRGINCSVSLPVMEIDGMRFHVNGDNLAIALYPNFDKVIIATLDANLKIRPKKFPEDYTRLEIVVF